MKHLCLIAFFCSLVSSPADAQMWQDFSPPGAGFSISLPGPPTQITQPLPTSEGNFELKMAAAQLSKDEACLVGWTLLPEFEDPSTRTKVLVAAKSSAIANMGKGKLIYESETQIGSWPGLIFDFQTDAGQVIHSRAYGVRNMTYFLSINTTSANERSGDVDRFFNSFTIAVGEEPSSRSYQLPGVPSVSLYPQAKEVLHFKDGRKLTCQKFWLHGNMVMVAPAGTRFVAIGYDANEIDLTRSGLKP